MKRAVRFLCIGMTGLATTAIAAADPTADICIAPGGDDAGPGSVARPFATLVRAQKAVREKKASGNTGDLVVRLRGGTYRIASPVEFGP